MGMNRENAKHRVPANAELETEDVESPPDSGVLRGLKNLFRVGRFRVSDKVGARKHVAAAPTGNQAPPRTSAPPGSSGSWSASVRSGSLRVPENVGSGKRVDPAPVPRQASKSPVPSTSADKPARTLRGRLHVSDIIGGGRRVDPAPVRTPQMLAPS